MFYPGDPMEQRKRELIKKLSGGRNGGGGFGAVRQGVSRMPGFFGSGVGFGRGLKPELPPQAGGGPGYNPNIDAMNPSMGPSGQFNLGGDIMPVGGAHPSINPGQFFPTPQPTINPDILHLLGNYGSQPVQPQAPSGYGFRYF